MDHILLANLYANHIRELTTRYGEALGASGYDAVTLHSGAAKKRSEFDDQYWSLRPTPHFQHWAPLAQPDCAIVVEPGKKTKLVWMKDQSFWENAAVPELDFWKSALDIVEVTNADDAKDQLPRGHVAFIGEERVRAQTWGFSDADVNPDALLPRLDQLRVKKTAYEIMCLEEANRRAARGHDALAKAFRSGDATELELHLLYLRSTGQDDPETPYKNIVALGENAATLHHITYRKTPTRGTGSQALLVDAGATFLGYCSDITRTHVKGSGAAAGAFGSLVSSVERFQKRLCTEIAIGSKYEALHDRAHRDVAVALREASVTTLSVDEAVASGVTRAFLPHGLGHSLGLQCHDVGCALIKPRPDNPFLRNTSIIGEGQVFTIEPGIDFIPALLEPVRKGPHGGSVDWKLVDELGKMGGVRIEDDSVVVGGEKPARNLTREFLP